MQCKWCNEKLTERERIFRDGTKHVELFCIKCNRSNGFKRTVTNEDFILPFGMHKGTLIVDLPKDYIVWGIKNLKGGIQKRFEEELLRRTL